MEPLTQTAIINRAIGLKQAQGYIDVIKLAQSYGIDIYVGEEKSEEDFNACITYDKDSNKYKILVNPTQPLERQRFSIAHELAHFILHKGRLDVEGKLNRDPNDNANKAEEEKADDLAAKILMPEKYVKEYARSENLNKSSIITREIISRIANYFKVSRTVAAIRLRELNFFVPYISFS